MAANKHDCTTVTAMRPDLSRPEERFEHRDVNVWAVYKFGIALAFLCVLSRRRCCSAYIATFSSREGGPDAARPGQRGRAAAAADAAAAVGADSRI